jgi:serine/threonine protein kinase
MEVNCKINSGKGQYIITKKIGGQDRENANVYICKDENGKMYIAKHFYKGRVMPNVSYGKKNHYGRRRDGSEEVFYEIKSKCKTEKFLLNHYERFRYKGKWVIILEYIDGVTMSQFLKKNAGDYNKVSAAVIALAKTLSIWHSNGFAHGDPHLDNCMVQIDESGETTVKLIDYCQLHHKDFKYCKQYDCFASNPKRRLIEDLDNTKTSHFGNGFRVGIQNEFKENVDRASILELFDKHYKVA